MHLYLQESTCSVEPEGACFTHLERNDEALCYICNSTESQTELVFETGQLVLSFRDQ